MFFVLPVTALWIGLVTRSRNGGAGDEALRLSVQPGQPFGRGGLGTSHGKTLWDGIHDAVTREDETLTKKFHGCL